MFRVRFGKTVLRFSMTTVKIVRRQVQFEVFEKVRSVCLFFQIAQEKIVLLINNIYEKITHKQIHVPCRNTWEINSLLALI